MKGQSDKTSRSSSCLKIVRELFRDFHPRDFAVKLWDGTGLEAEAGYPARFTLTIRHPGALRNMFWRPSELALGESFIFGDFDVEGDLETATGIADHFSGFQFGFFRRLRIFLRLLALPSHPSRRPFRGAVGLSGRPHTCERDRKAVTYHYDLSNEFYSLWLDPRMVYSCAYFTTEQEDLETAQERKLDAICKKLRLSQGQKLLDIGCGWGSLILHAAKNYGVEAVGITLSQPQADMARARIQKAGLAHQCRVEVRDYRKLERFGEFDKLASVGMVEHVGSTQLPQYFEQAWRFLRPGGLFLNHGISRNPLFQGRPGPSFTHRYVFPDGELLPIHHTLRVAENTGFEVRDLENLREHYTLTLRRWKQRLEDHREEALRIVDPTVYRTWRLFLAGYAYGFHRGRWEVFQALLLKPDGGKSELPLARSDWRA